jgi:hypothetical protein
MVLVNRAHLLGIFCLKQTLCELEPSIHICSANATAFSFSSFAVE